MNKGEPPMNDTMPDTVSQNELDELKRDLQRVGDEVAQAAARPQLSDAVLALVAAMDYQDETLLYSSCASLLAAIAELARDFIARELKESESTKTGLKEGWQKYINKKAFEMAILEEIKDKIESIIDERIASMLKIRKIISMLQEQEQQVENAPALEGGIRDLRRFREEILKGWPSRKPPSAIDRAAVAKARDAIARGDKGMSKDELVWGDQRSEKAV
jgi:hypothetical protein